jgi:hypothetical protein
VAAILTAMGGNSGVPCRGMLVPTWIWIVGAVVLVLGVSWGVRNQVAELLGGGGGGVAGVGGKPTIWWHVDDSQVNARQWLDWFARSTREPNEPYLKICQARAVDRWTPEFTVEPIVGRLAALQRLEAAGVTVPEGADRCPPVLWMAWCRAAYLRRFGGLWVDGSVLPIASGATLRQRLDAASALTFGADAAEGLSAGEAGQSMAGASAGWAARPDHPVWRGLEGDLAALIAAGDQSWGAVPARQGLRTLWDKHCSGVVGIDRAAEVSRDAYGRRLELDTLLGETDWPAGSTKDGLWVPLPDGRDGLERASPWLWFMRMSVEQILEAPFVWAQLARTH